MSDLSHTHCDNCINLRECQKYLDSRAQNSGKSASSAHARNGFHQQRQGRLKISARVKASVNENDGCEIISCPEKCDFRFHACKLPQHLHLCSRRKVDCINAGNGCDMVMERRFTGPHLARCPASVVVCTMEWSRRSAGEVPFEQDPTHLDVAALNADLETLRDFRRNVPAGLRRLLQRPTHESAMMPLAVAGNRIPESIASLVGAGVETEGHVTDDLQSAPSTDKVPGRVTYSPPAGLQGSLVQQLQSLSSTNGATECDEKPLKEPKEDLSIVIDVITKHSGRRLAWSTFLCAQELRRDEFADHFRNVHSEIRTQLDGWLFRRCPLASYGCSHGSPKFFPSMEIHDRISDYQIRFNEQLKTFCPTQRSTVTVQGSECRPGASLSSLPNELLLRLTKYLDPSSLKCLTLTSVRMRDVCAEVVTKRGIVVLDWEKDGKASGWRVRGKRWMFSAGFSPIRRWRMSEIPSIGSHMLTCHHYATQKNVQTEPYSYPVKEEDL